MFVCLFILQIYNVFLILESVSFVIDLIQFMKTDFTLFFICISQTFTIIFLFLFFYCISM